MLINQMIENIKKYHKGYGTGVLLPPLLKSGCGGTGQSESV